MAAPFIGEIRIFSGNFAPLGWAFCNGQTISIAQNTALFSLLGTYYGGNGTTTFCLPNLRGSFPVHSGTGMGLNPVELGESGGLTGITITPNSLPAHTHPLMATSAAPTTHSPAGATLASLPRNEPPIYSATSPSTSLSPLAIGLTGGGQPYQNVQPYLALNFIIAMEGIYPARN